MKAVILIAHQKIDELTVVDLILTCLVLFQSNAGSLAILLFLKSIACRNNFNVRMVPVSINHFVVII
ncbi:hypothetical protein QR98_0066430 [Sarcoptes scabiei]|uniref:Uncharacterized protein n=1 Tax=Sarcoptes scabiei TaxID=52283 RepID=A0A132AB76_SARSC|nr:hypothetical protein QR98_0066430 [Sarcoptes scabiei]